MTPETGAVQRPETPVEAPVQTQAVCTVISKNYLARARVFAKTLALYHPGLPVFVCLADRVDGFFNASAEPFEIIPVTELDNIPDAHHFFFKYNTLELNTAVKPFFF